MEFVKSSNIAKSKLKLEIPDKDNPERREINQRDYSSRRSNRQDERPQRPEPNEEEIVEERKNEEEVNLFFN